MEVLGRHRHITVGNAKASLVSLADDDIICLGALVTGNPAVVRNRMQIGSFPLTHHDQ